MAKDDLHEPRKHTVMYDEMCMRIVGGDNRLKQVIGEINSMMRTHNISPSEMQRIMRFVCERQRWAEYAIRQTPPSPHRGEAVPDDDDEELQS
jgi:hypothetical protein